MAQAMVFSYLDRNQGAGTVLLSLALVVVTIYYAVQNHKMAEEMKRARETADRPKLGLDFHRLGPTTSTLAIRNVGPGSAF